MAAHSTVDYRHYLIERIKPNSSGFRERVVYTGNKRNKPKGWRVVCPWPGYRVAH